MMAVIMNVVFLGEITCREDFYQYLVDIMDGTFGCGLCNAVKPHKAKENILQHIESKHFPDMFSYPVLSVMLCLELRRLCIATNKDTIQNFKLKRINENKH